MVEAILRTLRDTWSGYLEALVLILPRLLSTLSVVLVGWLIAAVARAVVARLLGWLRLPRLAERTGAAEFLRKAELPPADRLAAAILFWLLFGGFVLAGFDALGFRMLAVLRQDVTALVPRLVASLLILAVGLALANLIWRVVLLAAVNAGWPYGRSVSAGVYLLVLTVAVAMALEHLGVAPAIVLVAFAIAFGALMLALAIALGLGGGPIVRRLLEERLAQRGRPGEDASAHL
ncbi:MAG TPA: hypothetical protein VMX54_17995 [Vicinamibacteria bacterium]|nr:hypothetical protein [Vicinamibacteria bacterium]